MNVSKLLYWVSFDLISLYVLSLIRETDALVLTSIFISMLFNVLSITTGSEGPPLPVATPESVSPHFLQHTAA